MSTVRSHAGNRAKRFLRDIFLAIFVTFWALKSHPFASVGCHFFEKRALVDHEAQLRSEGHFIFAIFFPQIAADTRKSSHFSRKNCSVGRPAVPAGDLHFLCIYFLVTALRAEKNVSPTLVIII